MDSDLETILEKLTTIEEVLEQFLPLMARMVNHLEGQASPGGVQVATYQQLYGTPEVGPPEGELVATRTPVTAPQGWVARMLTKVQP